ncbi:gamma-glutamyltransferase [Mesorhizobium sp. M1405]|uniref:gamma-glutamyltransferase n=1 Tax=Mesorhizobium sp. M1405 TaxID=2957098 RepID=UPI003337014B
MLAAGGNAIDAAIAALFTLTVVEPMMVGCRVEVAHIRLANGAHHSLEGLSTAPLATGPAVYTPDPKATPGTMDTIGRRKAVGHRSRDPGRMLGWCEALRRFGPFFLADVPSPRSMTASRGFRMTLYQQVCVSESAADLA